MKKVIAIDYDNTIVNNCYPESGVLKPNVKKALNKLKKNGYQLILWTCRSGDALENAIKLIKEENLPFDFINENDPDDINKFIECYKNKTKIGKSPKIYYDVLIDDKSLNCPLNWKKIPKKIKRFFKLSY